MLPNTLGVALKVCNLGLLQIARGPLAAVRWVTMHAAFMKRASRTRNVPALSVAAKGGSLEVNN